MVMEYDLGRFDVQDGSHQMNRIMFHAAIHDASSWRMNIEHTVFTVRRLTWPSRHSGLSASWRNGLGNSAHVANGIWFA